MPVSKSDFVQWRHSAVTQEFLESVLAEADTYIAGLIINAGLDSNSDRYRVGRIDGLRTLAEWQPEFIEEEEEDA